MDPNLFYLNWERLTEVLITVVVLAFILERALSLVFEHRLYINKFHKKGMKEPIAFLVAYLVCRVWHFDAVSMILLTAKTSILGELITAGIIAGGSKGSVRLFRNIMHIKSTAAEDRENIDKKEKRLEASM